MKWLRNPPTNAAAAAVLLGVVVVIVVQMIHNDGAADGTTLALVAIAAVLTFAILAPRQTGRAAARITNFKFAGMEVGMAAVASAKGVRPPGKEGDESEVKRKGEGYNDVVGKLRGRLRFARLILELEDEIVDSRNYFAIVWKLRALGLLDEEEAHFVLDLVSGRQLDLSGLPLTTEDEFLDASWSFASRFGPMVWDRYVRRELRAHGWIVADFPQDSGHRPEFLAQLDGEWFAMSARVGGAKKPFYYGPTRERLLEYSYPAEVSGRCIVIPRIRQATVVDDEGVGWGGGVKVLRFQGSLQSSPEHAAATDPHNEDAYRPPEEEETKEQEQQEPSPARSSQPIHGR